MDKKTNVLIAHYRSDAVSGAEFFINDFVSECNDRFCITMLIPGEGSLSSFYRLSGLDVWTRCVETRRRRYPGLHSIQSWAMAQELKKRNIHVMLCNTFPAASRVGMACRFAGIPYGIYVREYISDKAVHRNILSKANLIFAESRDVQCYLNSMVNPAKIKVAYDYIDAHPILERVFAHRLRGVRLLPFENRHPVVGIVGRISKYKQQDLFIRAIPYVLKELPETRFVVVGGSQTTEKDYEDHVKQLASEFGIQDKVVFMGPRKDAIEITSELSVSCLASSREPLGRVILEAHLINCPVIAPNTGGPPEVVEDEVTGLLFSSTGLNPEQELAERIIRLLLDNKLRDRLTAKASEKVHTTFAGIKHVREFENLLDKLRYMDGKTDNES